MKKCVTLLKSAVLSFMIYMWFLGSSILIKIDSESRSEKLHLQQYFSQSKIWDEKMTNFSITRNSYCKTRTGGNETVFNTIKSNNLEKANDASQSQNIFAAARQEKATRDNLIYIPELKQMWCLVPKAASTFWSYRIIEFLAKTPLNLEKDLKNASIPVQVALRKYFGNIGSKLFTKIGQSEKIQRVILARHPFSRIVSAFEDKLRSRKAKQDSMYFYGHYGVKIKKSFRKNMKTNKMKEPTFEEFVDYLLETDILNYDEHWKPITSLCGVCHLQYNYIIKQETLGRNLSFHLKRLGFLDPTENNVVEMRDENKSTKKYQNIGQYFKNVSKEKVQKLFHKYEDDFKLFQYDYSSYLSSN